MPRGVPKSGKRKRRVSSAVKRAPAAAGRYSAFGSTRYKAVGGKGTIRKRGNTVKTALSVTGGAIAGQTIGMGIGAAANRKNRMAGAQAGAHVGAAAGAIGGRRYAKKKGYVTKTKSRLSVRAAKKVGSKVRRKK